MTMRGMRFDRMDRRIRLESYTETQSATGAVTKTWATLATVWASVRRTDASESTAGDQWLGTKNTEFRIRHRTDVSDKVRIVYESNNYDITSVIELGRREGLLISAVLRAND